MKHPTLFDVSRDKPTLRARINAFKELHGIVTHRSDCWAGDQFPWIAVPIVAVRKRFAGYGLTDTSSLFECMEKVCRLIEESDLIGYGKGELSAIRALCKDNNIPCDL